MKWSRLFSYPTNHFPRQHKQQDILHPTKECLCTSLFFPCVIHSYSQNEKSLLGIRFNSSILIIFHFSAFDVCLFVYCGLSMLFPSFSTDGCGYSNVRFFYLLLHLKTSLQHFSSEEKSAHIFFFFFFMKYAQSAERFETQCCKCISFLYNSYVSMAKHDAYRRRLATTLNSLAFLNVFLETASVQPHSFTIFLISI